jgi:hypothetical protein
MGKVHKATAWGTHVAEIGQCARGAFVQSCGFAFLSLSIGVKHGDRIGLESIGFDSIGFDGSLELWGTDRSVQTQPVGKVHQATAWGTHVAMHARGVFVQSCGFAL